MIGEEKKRCIQRSCICVMREDGTTGDWLWMDCIAWEEEQQIKGEIGPHAHMYS
jgi:hypothetical protein